MGRLGLHATVSFGETVHDILGYFASLVLPSLEDQPWRDVHVAGVCIDADSGGWLAANGDRPQINHYVIARLSRGMRSVGDSSGVHAPLLPRACAHGAAMRASFFLEPTASQGDCAIDAMAHYMGLPRDACSWRGIRRDIAAFMEEHAADEAWQEIAVECGEAESGQPPGGSGAARPGPRVTASWAAAPKSLSLAAPPSGSEGAALVDSLVCVGDDPDSPQFEDESRQANDALSELPPLPAPGTPPCALVEAPRLDAVVPLSPCKEPRLISGSIRFIEWIKSLTLEDLDKMSQCYTTFKDSEMAILKAQGFRDIPLEFRPQKHFMATKRSTRLAMGARFLEWVETPVGKASKATHRVFLQATREDYQTGVPKKARKWLSDCVKAWREHLKQNASLGACLPKGRRPVTTQSRVPEALLMRRRGLQGRPHKSPELRDLLWDWFVDVRASVAGILTPKMVMCKAKDLCERILQAQRSSGCYAALPQISRMWLLRWKRDRGVVLRKPNARFKCSKEQLLRRLRHMWLNLIRVRRLALRLLRKDLADQIFGIDEKPLHFNEGGSKAMQTLEIAGAPVVRLKQNHAATNERVSLMTFVTSNPDFARSYGNLPLELMCKGKTARRLASVRTPPDMRVSTSWSEKGSYRQEHLLAYLTRWLEPWTEVRARANDWRILMMDVAKSHLGEEVVALCHSRGYA